MTTELPVLEADETPVAAPLTLFGTQDPSIVIDKASHVASALANVIDERRLFTKIQGRAHVQVEGWTLLGSMLGVFAEVEWSHKLDNGWEARAVARTLNGNVVGAAEAMCTRSERTWSQRDEYAIRSMAQTRAVSKALRLPLGFIIELAGYSATPAEELNEEQASGERENRSASRSGGKASGAGATTPTPASARDRMLAAARQRGIGAADLEKMAALVGVPANTKATDEQIDAIIQMIETGETTRPNEPAAAVAAEEAPVTLSAGASNESTAVATSGSSTPDAAVTEAAGVPPASAASEPPQHGTPEYRAWFDAQPQSERMKLRAQGLGPSDRPKKPPVQPDAPEVAEQVGAAL